MNRDTINRVLLKAVRLYTYNTPVSRGKHRAYDLALRLCGSLPDSIPVEIRDGRKFLVDLNTGMQASVFFLGEYEKALTDIVESVLRAGDVCIDVGANFGWYTTLFWKRCKPHGHTHSFEPVPSTFDELQQNVALIGNPVNLVINNLALGERPHETNINVFSGLPTGHASFSDQGRSDAVSFKCKVRTLDSYLEEKEITEINFVKVDIEGTELQFLRGAKKLFQQAVPPILLMEMALNQTKNFGYVPNDLITFVSELAEYDFYKVDEINTRLIEIDGFDKDDIGANVICFPRGFYEDRFASLQKYL